MRNLQIEQIAEGITDDKEKQVWLKRVISELYNASWILPDETLRVVKRPKLWGMIRRRRNQAEFILEMLKKASKS